MLNLTAPRHDKAGWRRLICIQASLKCGKPPARIGPPFEPAFFEKTTNAMKLKTIHTLIFLAIAFTTSGCEMMYSDNANFARQRARANSAALAASKEASRAAAPADAVTGDALRRLLAGNSHVQEFRKAVADAKPYFTTYTYFSPDGAYISRDTYSRRTADYEDAGTWSLKENVLCVVVNTSFGNPQNCYTLKVASNGLIQYWVHNPGNEWHGVVTMNISIVRAGLQTPEYATTREAYQR